MTNANPAGLQRRVEVRLLTPLAGAFTVYRVGRRVGLEPGTTMADLVNDYAEALEDEFGEPVDVLGISTGGHIALQLAADRPLLVERLPNARLVLYENRAHGGTLADRRFGRDVVAFLTSGQHDG